MDLGQITVPESISDLSSGIYRPLLVIIGVELVQKIEMGLECGQTLPRKLRNTVLMQQQAKKLSAPEHHLRFALQNIFCIRFVDESTREGRQRQDVT
jgi:hypothetical protein